MSTAGIDMGAQFIKAVIVDDSKIIGQSIAPTGFEPLESAQKALDEAVTNAGITREDVKKIIATGAGRKSVNFADSNIRLFLQTLRQGLAMLSLHLSDRGHLAGNCLRSD